MRLSRRALLVFGAFLIAAAIALNIFFNAIYRLPILMYHSIDYTADKSDRMFVSPQVFEKQMKFLRDRGYNVIPLEEAVGYISRRARPPARTVAITIDDGYENNYKYAYPVLKKYDIPATIFVIVGLVGREGFMNWDQIKELSASGIVDIESHSMTHPWLTGIDDSALRYEMEESRKTLKDVLGKDVKYVCYPMGGYDERVKSAARRAGYEAGFATKPTRLSPNYDVYEIKRVRISSNSNPLFVFAIKISGCHAFLRLIQDDYKNIPTLYRKFRYEENSDR